MGSQVLNNQQAIAAIEQIQQHPNVATAIEPANLRSIWLRLATRPTPSPRLWMDAYLAGFAIAGDYRMVTFDKAFRQFQSQGMKLTLLK